MLYLRYADMENKFILIMKSLSDNIVVFFLLRYDTPDEWTNERTAYTSKYMQSTVHINTSNAVWCLNCMTTVKFYILQFLKIFFLCFVNELLVTLIENKCFKSQIGLIYDVLQFRMHLTKFTFKVTRLKWSKNFSHLKAIVTTHLK